jgi:hypothetical protein
MVTNLDSSYSTGLVIRKPSIEVAAKYINDVTTTSDKDGDTSAAAKKTGVSIKASKTSLTTWYYVRSIS